MKFIILFLVLVSGAMAATSQENRSGKKWEATIQEGFDYRFGTTQFMVSYFLDSDNLIGAKGGHNKSSGSHEQQTNFALQYKHYFGNSFYLAGEGFYLNTLEDTDWFFADNGNSKYSSLGYGIRLGNQWTWKNFTLGCDWFGIGQRVGTFTKEDGNWSDTTLTVLNLFLGASF